MTDTSTTELRGIPSPRSARVKPPSCLGKSRQLTLEDLRMFRRAHSQLEACLTLLEALKKLKVCEWMKNDSTYATGRLIWRQCVRWIGVKR